MKKTLVLISLLISSCLITAQKPRVTILATGGTIAGAAPSATQSSYTPGIISIQQIIESVPGLSDVAILEGIQICNIASQNMTYDIWSKLYNVIDSLFQGNHCDGVVITHGTDTMEETAYFLNLTLNYDKPVILTGSMRPSTSLSADGPINLYDAVSLCSSSKSAGRGVMVVMNGYILSADDVTKSNTTNSNAFECPNYGPMGIIRGGEPIFYRNSQKRHTVKSEFDLIPQKELPNVEIVYAYAFSSDAALNGIIHSGAKGVIIAGVGHGNYNLSIEKRIKEGIKKGITFVRSTRIARGGVDKSAEEYSGSVPVAGNLTPQKARILLMLALHNDNNPGYIQRVFEEY